MGRRLDLSGLTEDEAEHVLKVVQRDMRLRKAEEQRLSEMKQELAEEGSRCSILARQRHFNEHCCIRCCAPFTFLLNPKRRCLDCRYNVCKGCRTYSQPDKAWLCSACQKGRVLRVQSLEWYYNNVKSRFKRFGSAKVLKTLYHKHVIERGGLSDLPEGSLHEGSNDNDGSICGSEVAFYRQSEGHSMAETLTVALRVAEEAIEEAIAKAEEFSDSLEKQNEARYLRDHKEELIEELATTIVQKIIQRRKRSEMQTEYDLVWPQSSHQPLSQPANPPSPSQPHASSSSQAAQDQLRTSSSSTLQCSSIGGVGSYWDVSRGLAGSPGRGCMLLPDPKHPMNPGYNTDDTRSRSAFSLTSDDSPEKGPEEVGAGAVGSLSEYASLKREPKAASLPSWKSMDRLDNSSASSVLQSPDGNWIALPSAQLSRPGLLAKRKSLVYSVLEKESGVVSAYDEMGSESEGGGGGGDDDEGGWVAALRQFRRKLSDETYYTDSQHDPEWTYTQHLPVTSPSSGQFTNTETLNSDSEASSSVVSSAARSRKPPHNLLKKRGPTETHLHPQHQSPYHHHPHHHNAPPYPLHPDALDVNFNPKVLGDSSEADERHNEGHVKRSRRRRKSRRESPAELDRTESQSHTQSIYPLVQENSDFLLNALLKRTFSEERSGPDSVPGVPSKPALTSVPDASTSDALTPEPEDLDTVAPNSVAPSPSEEAPSLTPPGPCYSPPSSPGPGDPLEEELRSKLIRLASRASSQEEEDDSSSEDDGPTHRETSSWLNGRDRSHRHEAGGRPRDRPSSKEGQRIGEVAEQANAEGRARERRLETGGEGGGGGWKGSEEKADDKVEKRGGGGGEASRREGGRRSKRQQRREVEEEEGAERSAGGGRRSGGGTSASSADVTPSPLEGALLDGQEGQKDLARQRRLELLNSLLHQKYSAASLCSITTEVLKVLNATEELIGEAGSESHTPAESMNASPISSIAETSRLDQRLTKMEENVYLAAGAVYGLEGALGDLEECARSVSSGTTDTELSFLEDQVATAAAQVQQSELKISNIEARISALKTAGLNVTACNRFSKFKPKPTPQTLDSSRHQRRKLPAPPLKGALQEKLEPEQQVLQP